MYVYSRVYFSETAYAKQLAIQLGGKNYIMITVKDMLKKKDQFFNI
jgi:hypothetical protein